MSNDLPITPTIASLQCSTPKTKTEFNRRTNGLIAHSALRVGAVIITPDLATQLQTLVQTPASPATTDTITVS